MVCRLSAWLTGKNAPRSPSSMRRSPPSRRSSRCTYLQRQSFSGQPSSGNWGDYIDRKILSASFPAASQDISPGAIFTARHCVDDLSLWLADDVFDRERFDLMRLPGRVATRNPIATTTIARMIMTNRVFMVHPHGYSEARRWEF